MPHFLAIMADTRVDHIEGEGPSLIGRDWLQHNICLDWANIYALATDATASAFATLLDSYDVYIIPFSSQHSNPLYVTPQTEYKNPILEKSDEAEEEDY